MLVEKKTGRFSPEDDDVIVRGNKMGMIAADIGETIGRTGDAVRNRIVYLRKAGRLPPSTNPRRVRAPEEEDGEIKGNDTDFLADLRAFHAERLERIKPVAPAMSVPYRASI